MIWREQKNVKFHSRNAEIDVKEFKTRMRALRNEDYSAMLYEVRKGLNFTGEMSNVEMEILLIRVVEISFPKDASLKTSIKRDIFLMSLGLLKEFSQYKNIGERRLRFIQESDYITVHNKGEYASYDENEITEAVIDKMLGTLKKAEERAIDFIANKLYEEEDCNKYSESLSKYYKCNSGNSDCIPDNELPSLRHPRRKIDKTTGHTAVIKKEQEGQEQETDSSDPSEKSKDSKKTGKKKKKRSRKKKFIKKCAALLACLVPMVASSAPFIQITVMQHAPVEQTEKDTPRIEKIQVFDNPISLPSGQSDEIVVKCLPIGADEDELNCISDNPDIATVENLIVTAKEWQEGNNTTKVFIGSTYAQKVDVDIIVEPPDPANKAKRGVATSENISSDSESNEYK